MAESNLEKGLNKIDVAKVTEQVLLPPDSVMAQFAFGKEKQIGFVPNVGSETSVRGKKFEFDAHIFEAEDGRQRVLFTANKGDPKNYIDGGAVIKKTPGGVIVEQINKGKSGFKTMGGKLAKFIDKNIGKIIPDPDAPLSEAGRKATNKLLKRGESNLEKALLDRDGLELEDLAGNKPKLNKDGTVTLYHATSKANAEKIRKEGFKVQNKGATEGFFSTTLKGTEGHGDEVVKVNIKPNKLSINDAFRDGTINVTADFKDIPKRNVLSSAIATGSKENNLSKALSPKGKPVWWTQPSDNPFAKDMTQGEVIMDWLKRNEVKKEDGKFVFYHASPKKGGVKDTINKGSYLATDAETALQQAGRDRGIKSKGLNVFKIAIEPEEIGHAGVWTTLRNEFKIGSSKVAGAVKKGAKLLGTIPAPGLAGKIGGKRGESNLEKGLKLFHGTASKFDDFKDAKKGSITGARSAKGAIWFTDDIDTAKGYSIYAAEDGPVQKVLRKQEELEKIARKSGKAADFDKADRAIIAAEKLDTPDLAHKRRLANANVKEATVRGNFLEVDAKGKTPFELALEDAGEKGTVDSWLNKQLQEGRRQGKDGVKFKNLDDAAGLANKPSTHVAVFNAKSISTGLDKVKGAVKPKKGLDKLEKTLLFLNKNKKSIRAKSNFVKELERRAINEFGLTSNIDEAGYILSDGRLLDFSGKNQGGPGGERVRDHREIEGIFDKKTFGKFKFRFDAVTKFGRDTGAIRIGTSDEDVIVNNFRKPTQTQVNIIKDAAKVKGGIIADNSNPRTGDTIDAFDSAQNKKFDIFGEAKSPQSGFVDFLNKYFKKGSRLLGAIPAVGLGAKIGSKFLGPVGDVANIFGEVQSLRDDPKKTNLLQRVLAERGIGAGF